MAKIDFPDFKSEANKIRQIHNKAMAQLLAELNKTQKPLKKISRQLKELHDAILKQRKLAQFVAETEAAEKQDKLTSSKLSRKI